MKLAVRTSGLTHSYGRAASLRGLDLAVPEGSFYTLLGPNGAGKTTLLRILTGVLRPSGGSVSVLGHAGPPPGAAFRADIGYVAEGQRLPEGLTLTELERFLAPLYPRWDAALAADLRARFRLDPTRRIGRLSRGDYMKAALLCALASRPRLLILDEPFTGMDVRVRDELVRGVLGTADEEGWTVLVSSHDIGEVEMLADHVGILDEGRLVLEEPTEPLIERFGKPLRDIFLQVTESGASPVEVRA